MFSLLFSDNLVMCTGGGFNNRGGPGGMRGRGGRGRGDFVPRGDRGGGRGGMHMRGERNGQYSGLENFYTRGSEIP